MSKLSLQKDCQLLKEWMKAIINHLYWVASSTPNGDGKLMLEKWRGMVNHLHNVHDHQENTMFKKCQHPPAYDCTNKKWLTPGRVSS